MFQIGPPADIPPAQPTTPPPAQSPTSITIERATIQMPAESGGPLDYQSWGLTEWLGVLGFVLSWAIPLSIALYRLWVKRQAFRVQVTHYRESAVVRPSFHIHQTRGAPFNLDGVRLKIRAGPITDQHRKAIAEKGKESHTVAFPSHWVGLMVNLSPGPSGRFPVESGSTIDVEFAIPSSHPAELIDETQPFAILELRCQGEVLRENDVSTLLKPEVDYLRWRRHRAGVTVYDYSAAEIERLGKLYNE